MNPPGAAVAQMLPASDGPALLPAGIGAELARLEERLCQVACEDARQELAELGEATAVRVLRKIGESQRVRTLSGFIMHMARQERMKRNARCIPTAHSAACLSGPSREEESVTAPLYYNMVQMDVQNPHGGEIAHGLPNHAMEVGSPDQGTLFHLHENGGYVRQIAHVVPYLARLTVQNPGGRMMSPVLKDQDCIEVDPPAWAMACPLSKQASMQINSPIRAMAPANNDMMKQIGSPGHCMPSRMQNHMEIDSPIQQIISTRRFSIPSPVRDLSRGIENLAGPSKCPASPIWVMPQKKATTTCHASANALREAASPQMLALEELEFRKIFMIFAYLSCDKIEKVLSVDYIRSLKFLSMAEFEKQIWSTFGHGHIAASDRAKNLDSDPGLTKVYHCNVEIKESTVVKTFKGPYVENTRTHLQKVVGDDNVLVVKFMENSSDTKTDFSTYCEHYHKVAADGIVLGLRRYRFFLYKDRGKEKKMKEDDKKCSSSVRCYFVCTESGWNMDEPYILSGRSVGQARELFMHIHTAPTFAKYMARFALILSKTITLDVDLSTVNVRQIDDEPCLDEHGNIALLDGEPLIHTDGTGLISVDLALKCPTSIFKGKILKSQDIMVSDGKETMMRPNSSKRHRSLTTEHPLLMQFRLFYNGSAVKGTVLVDKRLPPRTICIRPSMLKVKTDPELSGVQSVNSLEIVSARNANKRLSAVQSVNSFEIVSTSNRPRRTLTSRFLIALLYYGGVPEEFFMELLKNAIEGAESARYDYEDALKIAFNYADMEDSISARMILSGIPLDEAYLQSRLVFMAQQERKGMMEGRIPIDDCYYLMGTTDPTGTLKPNEVCVILEKGQLSGDVLVYKPPGLHFGDVHLLKATHISDLEKKYVGYSKYAILFPTSGQRSLADEMANSDFDGDMYWVSNNPKLLEHFKPSEPWVPAIKPKSNNHKRPQDFDESKLERLLFHAFLKTRFTPSYALATAAVSWLVYMDRLLTDKLEESEKQVIKEKMIKLVDIYYLALDAPKNGYKINIGNDLMVKPYPHFMGRSPSYHSTSILGKLYDRAEDLKTLQSDNVQPIKITFLPCFMEREAPEAIKDLWKDRYVEYLTVSKLLVADKDKMGKEETDMNLKSSMGSTSICSTMLLNLNRPGGTWTTCSLRPA